MQALLCRRCERSFDAATARGYCDECVSKFREERTAIHRRQRPAPGVFADGKFAPDWQCPQSFSDGDRQVCGLCGSDELEQGYGLGSGYGMGSYTFCLGCNTFLDFHEDSE